MTGIKFDVVKATLKQIVSSLSDGSVTSVQLVEEYLERIERDNIQGRGLRAVIDVAPDVKLLEAAKKLDVERADGKIRDNLHGVPVLIKDSICTKSSMGMQTTGGTHVLEGSVISKNAPIVDKMLEDGMIVLGKTNMSIMGNFYGRHPTPWSSRGGTTLSFLDPHMPAGGSSVGSAVALSAGFCAAAIGSETDGSIVTPASKALLYAIKPTAGLVPGDRVIGVCPRIDTLGPMGKSAWDVAAMLESISEPSKDFVMFASAPYNDISRYSIGIPRSCFPSGRDEDDPLSETLQAEAVALVDSWIAKFGSSVRADPADFPGAETLFGITDTKPEGAFDDKPNTKLWLVDMYGVMTRYLSELDDCKVKTFEELIQWNDEHPDLAFYDPSKPEGQVYLERSVATKGIKDQEYYKNLGIVEDIGHQVEKMMDDKGLDVLLFSGCGWSRGCTVAATLGFPVATVPIGQLSNQRPCALHLLAKRGDDEKLIGLMAACQAMSSTS